MSYSRTMFAAAINPAETGLTYGEYLGQGTVSAAMLGSDGNFYVTGGIDLAGPVAIRNALDADIQLGGYLVALDPKGNVVTATKFGGFLALEDPTAMAADAAGNIYLGNVSGGLPDGINVGGGQGLTSLINFGASQQKSGFAGIFLAKIAPANSPQISLGYWNSPAATFYTLRNAGSADLHISSITSPGVSSLQIWGNCGSTIPAGTACVFLPAASLITIASDASPNQQTFSLPSTPASPQLLWLDPSVLFFPPQMAGTTSPPQAMKLWNVGTGNATVSSILGVGAFQVSHNCGLLQPGASCTIQVSAAPTASGGGASGLTIYSDATVIPMPQAVLEDQNDLTDELVFSTTDLEFGSVPVGHTSLPHTITVTNASNVPTVVPSPSVTAASSSTGPASDIAIAGNTCTGTLSPQQSCTVSFAFAPSGGESETALATIAGNSSPIVLRGTGTIPASIIASPASIAFGPVAASSAPSRMLSLTNNGAAAVTIGSIHAPAQFAETDNCQGALAVHQSCTVHVTFQPNDQIGFPYGSLNVILGDGSIALSVQLSGTSETDVIATPPSLTFGTVITTGTRSAGQTLTLTNISTSAQPVAPVFTGDFLAVSNTCPASLAAGQQCQLAIAFAPSVAGSEQGTMTLSFADGSPSMTEPLTGSSHPALSLSTIFGSSTTATVNAGQTASFSFLLTTGPAVSGTISLTCTGAPAYSTCSVQPSSFAAVANSASTLGVSVATTKATTGAYPTGDRKLAMAGIGLFGALLALLLCWRRESLRKYWPIATMLGFAMLATSLIACGGGGSAQSGGGISSSPGTPSGTYTLQLTVSNNSQSISQQLTLIVN